MSILQSLRVSIASAGLAVAAAGSTSASAAAPSPEEREQKPAATATSKAAVSTPFSTLEAPSEALGVAKQLSGQEAHARSRALAKEIARPETRLAALDRLSLADLEERQVTESVLAALGKNPTTISPKSADLLLQSDFFMCHALSLTPKELATKHQHLWLNIARNASPAAMHKATPMLSDVFAALIAENASLKKPEMALEMVPRQILRENPVLSKAFREHFDLSKASVSVLRYHRILGTSPDAVFSRAKELNEKTLSFESDKKVLQKLLISTLTPTALEQHPDSHKRILEALKDDPQHWPASEVMTSVAFKRLIIEAIIKDSYFASRVPPALYEPKSPEFSPEIRAAIEHVIKQAGGTLKYRSLSDIPALALGNPETRQRIRDEVNASILKGSPQEPLSSIPHPESFVRHIPEALRLPSKKPAEGLFTQEDLAALPTINPRGYAKILESCVVPDAHSMMSFVKTLAVFSKFGITGVSRFDNGREILRNRYAIADEQTRAAVRSLLPAGFFDGVEKDTRPFAICIVCHPEADYNNALNNINSSQEGFDHIDRLTDHYRVLLFEASSGKGLIGTLAEACDQHDVSAEVLLILGHGSQDSITLGRDSVEESRGDLFGEDPALTALRGLMKKGGHIALMSCSVASKKDRDSASVFTSFTRLFPECRIFAPRGETPTPKMRLSPQGEFESVEFEQTATAVYDPKTETVSETAPPSKRSKSGPEASSWIDSSISLLSTVMGYWPFYLGGLALFGVGRAVVKQDEEAQKKNSQEQRRA